MSVARKSVMEEQLCHEPWKSVPDEREIAGKVVRAVQIYHA